MDGIEITPKQRKAAELLATGQYTQKEVAGMVKVSEQTLCTWKKNILFMGEYDRLMRQQFQTMAAKAFKTQTALLDSKNDMVRYLAAKDLMDRGGFKPEDNVNFEGMVPVIIYDDLPPDD